MAAQETAFIIGVGPGLSASLAQLFAKEGMELVLGARDVDKLDALARETNAARFAIDVADPGSVEKFFADAVADKGTPDIVVYNPSARTRGPFVEQDPEAVKNVLMISCYGGFLVGQAAARLMLEKGSGSIQFTGASASVKGYPQSASFAMGKFGLRGLAQSMARELAPKGITVNAIAPGFFATEMNEALLSDTEFTAWVEQRTPTGRWGQMAEIGGAAAFLASDAASYVNGHVLAVDGGMSVSM